MRLSRRSGTAGWPVLDSRPLRMARGEVGVIPISWEAPSGLSASLPPSRPTPPLESRWLSWKVETMCGEPVREETSGLCGRLEKAGGRRDSQANLSPERFSSEDLHRANLLGPSAPDGYVTRTGASGESV